MYILRVVIFSLDEPNLTRILTVFKENLVKYKGKRTSRKYTFILFLTLKQTKSIFSKGYTNFLRPVLPHYLKERIYTNFKSL